MTQKKNLLNFSTAITMTNQGKKLTTLQQAYIRKFGGSIPELNLSSEE